jgi:hypothetical protein
LPEDLLRKYRPVGPPADLRARILVPERAAWPWAVAAAALLALTVGFHLATSALDAPVVASGDPFDAQSRIDYVTAALGGGEEARRIAALIVMDEELRRALPPVAAASSPGEPPR